MNPHSLDDDRSTGDPALDAALSGAPSIDGGEFDGLWSAVEGDLAAETGLRARLRALPSSGRLALALATSALVALAVALLSRRADIAVYPVARMGIEFVLYAGGLGALAWMALRPLHQRALPRGLAGSLLGFAVVLPIVLALLPHAHTAHPASLEGMGSDFAARAVSCFVFGVVSSIPLLVMAWLLHRSPKSGGRFAAAAAGAAGLLANVALLLHCPITHPTHIAVGHALVAVVFVGLALRRI